MDRHNALAAHVASLALAPVSSPGLCQVKLRAPWFNVQSWEATGKDAGSHVVQQAGYMHSTLRSTTQQVARSAADEQTLALPLGFKGTVSFFDANKRFVCRITFDKLGQEGFSVRSQQVDARVIGPHEIVVDKKVTCTRCYVSTPKSLGARQLILRDRNGQEQIQELSSPMGISLPLRAGFEGTLELVDSKRQLILRAVINKSGVAGADVQAQTIAGHCVTVNSKGGIVDLAVRAGTVRSRIY